jgi:hypothetical protein
MTQSPFIARIAHRRATALLLAAVALPSIAAAQDTVSPPLVTVPTQSAPVPVAPPIATRPAPATPTDPAQSRTVIAPGVAEAAEAEARERAAAARAQAREAAARTAPAPAAAAPAASAPAAVPEAAAPAATPPIEIAPPSAPPAAPADVPVVDTAPVSQPAAPDARLWLLLAGLGLAAAAIAAFALLRRRRNTVEADPVIAEPVPEARDAAAIADKPVVATREPERDPVAAAPMFMARRAEVEPLAAKPADPHPALDHPVLTRPDAEDLDAVLGGAAPSGDRPQLELAMRPMRAGINRDEAVVEFELTVANAGGADAQDVRIGAFMLSERPGQQSEIERLLIRPPADGVVDAERIAPGDGTRLDAAVTLPRDELALVHADGHDGFTPILLADARYRLPDGSEGRTAAAFAIGRVNGGEALMPIELGEDVAMYGDIEARLRSVAAKV